MYLKDILEIRQYHIISMVKDGKTRVSSICSKVTNSSIMYRMTQKF